MHLHTLAYHHLLTSGDIFSLVRYYLLSMIKTAWQFSRQSQNLLQFHQSHCSLLEFLTL